MWKLLCWSLALYFPEDRAFEVKQWEKSTFMWKIERFFYDQPQMFLEPSGISDSGAFSQSTFSELQSEEDKGNYQFVVVVVASLNYTYSCISPWRSCMTLWWLACVASVSARFRSKERGTRVKERAKNGSRFISRAAKTGLSLLRNQMETLATQAIWW